MLNFERVNAENNERQAKKMRLKTALIKFLGYML